MSALITMMQASVKCNGYFHQSISSGNPNPSYKEQRDEGNNMYIRIATMRNNNKVKSLTLLQTLKKVGLSPSTKIISCRNIMLFIFDNRGRAT